MISAKSIKKEKARVFIVQLIFVIYWLMFLEGPLRKWVFTFAQKPIYFIKDPFVLWVYFCALMSGFWPSRSKLFSYFMFLGACCIPLAILQVMFYQNSWLVVAHGWRMYFFYIPLAFIIGSTFRGEDLRKLIKQTLLLAIPLSALALYQLKAGPTAFVNKSVSDVVYTATGASGSDIVRVTGVFTFFHAQQIYLGILVALVLCCWILPKKERPLSGILLLGATLGAMMTFAVDVTRAPMILAAIVLASSLVNTVLARTMRIRYRSFILPLLLLVAAIAVALVAFSTTSQIKMARMTSRNYSTTARMIDPFTSFFDVAFSDRLAPIGYGIGFTAAAGSLSPAQDTFAVIAGEDEWRRTIVEVGPIMGIAYILGRIFLTIWLIQQAVGAVRRSGNPLPLLLSGLIASILLAWYICHIGAVFSFAWIFCGFCIAASQLGKNVQSSDRMWKP